jgi:hypothetical protein
MEVLKIIAISICSVCLILNSISILILVTTTKLTKSRFKTLVVFLSLSDAATGAEFLTHVVLNSFNYGQDSILYACLVLKHLIAGTVAFSLYQTLLICLDRLNATFTLPFLYKDLNQMLVFFLQILKCYIVFSDVL